MRCVYVYVCVYLSSITIAQLQNVLVCIVLIMKSSPLLFISKIMRCIVKTFLNLSIQIFFFENWG